MPDIDVVVGGQFGSEAKGTVAARLIDRQAGAWSRISVRVGGPNAGHTVVDHNGNVLRLRQVPVGVIFPDCALAIAAGSEVDLEVLKTEIGVCEQAGHQVRDRLFIDRSATVLWPRYRSQEMAAGLTDRLGSTTKGIGAARMDRVNRGANTVDQLDRDRTRPWFIITDVASMVRGYNYACLEGTQGYGLGLHTSFYPYCTSGDCRAIDVLAQVGVNPWDPKVGWVEPWLVFRPFPIRVAGNSGPLRNETSWEELGLQPEYTTVTQKVRRVGLWDPDLALDAIQANGIEVSVAITMADQTTSVEIADIARQLTDMGARVRMIGNGPELHNYDFYPKGML